MEARANKMLATSPTIITRVIGTTDIKELRKEPQGKSKSGGGPRLIALAGVLAGRPTCFAQKSIARLQRLVFKRGTHRVIPAVEKTKY